ncbi:uncharacterized protein BX664DRAFT_5385 [Halteromyces radiatus]|uniref:uncharacterized protein n=1 Tax=Halteromyces radiatus TaxID=101107 RepID=UPI0022209369|nr:uncharacterized protein BX664DRAFT_5385 [Halteromyces radiatus]KAI8098707.1 hypothetical protein BX664DRAFT_5385 [Halteromyces radiatus]
MAFAQQQRRPRHRSQPSLDDQVISPSLPSPNVISPEHNHITPSTTSDSETDWHVISSVLRSSSSSISPTSTTSTPHSIERHDSIEPSEPESFSSFRPSDTESFSDIDFAFGTLPAHDGTGAFVDMDQTSDEESTRQVQQLPLPDSLTPSNVLSLVQRTSPGDFDPSSPTKDIMVSSDEQLPLQQKDGHVDYNSATTHSSADHIKFTRKRRRNLDSIPTHHPSFTGTFTSIAILSAIWNNLRRLTNHLIENDTHTADAFTSLVSEATLEGCLPFGSHLHMELAAGLRPGYTSGRYDGLPGM